MIWSSLKAYINNISLAICIVSSILFKQTLDEEDVELYSLALMIVSLIMCTVDFVSQAITWV